MTNPAPNPSATLVRLSALLGNDPIALVRRARGAGLEIPEDLAGIPEIYRDGRPHQGTVRETCEGAGVDLNGYYRLKRQNPGMSQAEILAQLTGGSR